MNVKCANQANSPLLVRRGGCAVMKNVAKHPCSAQTGWSNMTQTRIPKQFGKSTTPSAPL